jgi:hypothetical protein
LSAACFALKNELKFKREGYNDETLENNNTSDRSVDYYRIVGRLRREEG